MNKLNKNEITNHHKRQSGGLWIDFFGIFRHAAARILRLIDGYIWLLLIQK
jgi:hypothetical protein